MPPTVRPSAKGVVIRDGKVLLLHHVVRGADYFELPGGGQRFGESVRSAAAREVWEETGVAIEVGARLWVRDYIARNHEFADLEGHRHQVEFVFRCIPTGPASEPPTVPDDYQVGTVWIDLHEVAAMPLYPAAFKPLIAQLGTEPSSMIRYLGDVN